MVGVGTATVLLGNGAIQRDFEWADKAGKFSGGGGPWVPLLRRS